MTIKQRPSIKVILFDLGGVLVEWDGIQPLIELTRGRLTRGAARRFWLESPWIKKFETGQCTPNEFASGVISELHLSLTPEEFLQDFISWDRGVYPGGYELLAALKSHYTLACLSNNNPLHINRLREKGALEPYFHHWFVSYQTGLMKPEKQAFERVLAVLGSAPENILYFDDNQECVETAKGLGLMAYQVLGLEAVKQILRSLEIVM